jgi:hypothetical protein
MRHALPVILRSYRFDPTTPDELGLEARLSARSEALLLSAKDLLASFREIIDCSATHLAI